MPFSVYKNIDHAQQGHRAESHVGPGFRQGGSAVCQKTIEKIAVVAKRPQERDRLIIRCPGILQEAQDDRQKYNGCHQGADQSIPQKGRAVQKHAPELTHTVAPDRSPDRVQHRHDDHHVEEIEVAHCRHKDHDQKQPGSFFAEILFTADQQQRKDDKGIQKIMMPHSRERKTVENINESTGQDSKPVLSPHIEGIGAERDTRQIKARHEHQIMKMHQILLGHKNSRQAERIPDHIISQRRI